MSSPAKLIENRSKLYKKLMEQKRCGVHDDDEYAAEKIDHNGSSQATQSEVLLKRLATFIQNLWYIYDVVIIKVTRVSNVRSTIFFRHHSKCQT